MKQHDQVKQGVPRVLAKRHVEKVGALKGSQVRRIVEHRVTPFLSLRLHHHTPSVNILMKVEPFDRSTLTAAEPFSSPLREDLCSHHRFCGF
ncbi:MAG TPA: hypothetical protein VF600_18915 [Abditibacteriaceae bacterium]